MYKLICINYFFVLNYMYYNMMFLMGGFNIELKDYQVKVNIKLQYDQELGYEIRFQFFQCESYNY